MKDKPSPQEIIKRADNSEQKYADSFREAAGIYAKAGVYKEMANFAVLMRKTLSARYNLPANRPIVHIDIGSGMGNLLGELAKMYQSLRQSYLFIGVEVNDYLARYSLGQLRAEDHGVEGHLDRQQFVERDRSQAILRREYPKNEKILQSLNVTPDQRILLIQEDARHGLPILMSVLEKLRAEHGIDHIDSMTLGMPGYGTDLAIQDSSDLHLGNKEFTISRTNTIVREMMDNVLRFAQKQLGLGSDFITFQRLARNKVREIHKAVTQREFPTDPSEQLSAMMQASLLVLGKEMQHFRLRGGAILLENFQTIEAKSAMNYSSYSPFGGEGEPHERAPKDVLDLFALSVVREDLHAPGTTAYSFKATRSDDQ